MPIARSNPSRRLVGGSHHGRKRAVLLVAAVLLLTSGNVYAQDTVESDRAALVALYNANGGATGRTTPTG